MSEPLDLDKLKEALRVYLTSSSDHGAYLLAAVTGKHNDEFPGGDDALAELALRLADELAEARLALGERSGYLQETIDSLRRESKEWEDRARKPHSWCLRCRLAWSTTESMHQTHTPENGKCPACERDPLRAENERLREALRLVDSDALHCEDCACLDPSTPPASEYTECDCFLRVVRAAIANPAIGGGK